jgi:hypothetical protein
VYGQHDGTRVAHCSAGRSALIRAVLSAQISPFFAWNEGFGILLGIPTANLIERLRTRKPLVVAKQFRWATSSTVRFLVLS